MNKLMRIYVELTSSYNPIPISRPPSGLSVIKYTCSLIPFILDFASFLKNINYKYFIIIFILIYI